MRRMNLLFAALTLAGLGWAEAKAQPPVSPIPQTTALLPVPGPPVVDSPAYRQFLNSDSTHKTYSRLGSGSTMTRVTPFSAETHYVEPSYLKQRMTPYGFDSLEYVPGYGADFRAPWMAAGFRVPGYYRTFYAPPMPILPAQR